MYNREKFFPRIEIIKMVVKYREQETITLSLCFLYYLFLETLMNVNMSWKESLCVSIPEFSGMPEKVLETS